MLLGFERDLDAPVIRDLVAVLRAHDNGPDFHVPDEHLVEVAESQSPALTQVRSPAVAVAQ